MGYCWRKGWKGGDGARMAGCRPRHWQDTHRALRPSQYADGRTSEVFGGAQGCGSPPSPPAGAHGPASERIPHLPRYTRRLLEPQRVDEDRVAANHPPPGASPPVPRPAALLRVSAVRFRGERVDRGLSARTFFPQRHSQRLWTPDAGGPEVGQGGHTRSADEGLSSPRGIPC